MKHKLNITILAVAALLYAFGETAQAGDVVIDFDSVALNRGAGNKLFRTLRTYREDGYTMVVDSGAGGWFTNNYSDATLPFTGCLVVPWTDGVAISFTNDGGTPFSATSAAVGCGIAEGWPGQWTVIGHLVGGGLVGPIYLAGVDEGVKTILTFPPTFVNLTKLSFKSSGDGRAALDEITLEVPGGKTFGSK